MGNIVAIHMGLEGPVHKDHGPQTHTLTAISAQRTFIYSYNVLTYFKFQKVPNLTLILVKLPAKRVIRHFDDLFDSTLTGDVLYYF